MVVGGVVDGSKVRTFVESGTLVGVLGGGSLVEGGGVSLSAQISGRVSDGRSVVRTSLEVQTRAERIRALRRYLGQL